MPFAFHVDPAVTDCRLSIWSIAHSGSFVHALAAVYLRRPTHARRIITELQPGDMTFGGAEIDNAVKLLTVSIADIALGLTSADPTTSERARKTRDARVALRDGLLFQHVSWIAGTMQFPTARAKAPHVRVADKGFDGLFLEVASGTFARLVVCEDKATVNPRPTITAQVWPELIDTEAGEKDLELLDAVTALLDTLMSEDDRVAVIEGAIWAQLRQYRVAITASLADAREGGYGHIFDGFGVKAPLPQTVRMAEVMPLGDIRAELQELADKVIGRLNEIAAGV